MKSSSIRKPRGSVREQGLSSWITFHGWFPKTDLSTFYGPAHFLLLPSVSEGWPNVILEAMVCGKPVIGTRVGGVPEAIASEDYGIIVPPQDPVAMADAMKRALD